MSYDTEARGSGDIIHDVQMSEDPGRSEVDSVVPGDLYDGSTRWLADSMTDATSNAEPGFMQPWNSVLDVSGLDPSLAQQSLDMPGISDLEPSVSQSLYNALDVSRPESSFAPPVYYVFDTSNPGLSFGRPSPDMLGFGSNPLSALHLEPTQSLMGHNGSNPIFDLNETHLAGQQRYTSLAPNVTTGFPLPPLTSK